MNQLVREGYIGNPAQLVTLRRVTVNEGKAKGTEIIEVRTAGGLSLDILPDSGLDLGQCSYRGVNMSYLSKNGYDTPNRFIPYESEFMNTFSGGLLYTCGLRSAGNSCWDNGEYHPDHGRFHGLSADHVSAEFEGEEIVVRGELRETALFGHCLTVKREIRIPSNGAAVTLSDTITNETPRDEEFMVIYHCNFGYPMLSEKAQLSFPEERETISRTEFASAGLDRALVFEKPVPNEEERLFFQKMQKEFWARLVNRDLGMKMTLSWSGDTLPVLSEWRSMASGDYVLGLEPTNSYIMGRRDERENGTLQVLKAYESVTNTVKIEFAEA